MSQETLFAPASNAAAPAAGAANGWAALALTVALTVCAVLAVSFVAVATGLVA
jgi:hypothetical protein